MSRLATLFLFLLLAVPAQAQDVPPKAPASEKTAQQVATDTAMLDSDLESRLFEIEKKILAGHRTNLDTYMFALAVFFSFATLTIAGFAVVLPLMAARQQKRAIESMEDILKEAQAMNEEIAGAHRAARERRQEMDDMLRDTQEQINTEETDGTSPPSPTDRVTGDDENTSTKDATQSDFKSVKQAAELEDSTAQWQLGRMYEFGDGVEKDKDEAVKWYKESAKRDNAIGQWRLGTMYYFGHGVDENKDKAFALFGESAKQGDVEGQSRFGFMYELGHGVKEDKAKAFKWYKKSAKQGHAIGQWRLGRMYEFGEGVEENKAEAVKWYKKSAKQGNAAAQKRLGHMYEFGYGIPINFLMAYQWYALAKGKGDKDAEEALERISKKLPEEKIIEAQELAAQWKPEKT